MSDISKEHFAGLTDIILAWCLEDRTNGDLGYEVNYDIVDAYKGAGYQGKQVYEELQSYQDTFDASFDQYWDNELSSKMKERLRPWVKHFIPVEDELSEFCYTHFDWSPDKEEAQS